MTEPRLSVVKRDLKGVAKVMRGMEARLACFPDLVQVVAVVSRALEMCVSELAELQVGVDDQAELLIETQLFMENLEKRIADLETQTGLQKEAGA